MRFALGFVLFGLVLGLAQGHEGQSWALLVAGSNTWLNYRHQADVCHSFQIVKSHGIPEENIIVMMYDDIAFDESNPTPGVIINKPHGKNVYPGVSKDYTKDSVTPSVFLDVLSGVKPKVGSQRVINSTSEDNVFVYFADHGGPGILAFPNDVLNVVDLNKTIHKMHKEKRFKNLVFYIEACESGSMFDGILPKNGKVYAMTASDPDHSSYACYYSDKYATYLGDVYSVNWLEDADKENLKKETIEKQFHIVKKETNTSTVCQYGDGKVSLSPLSEFLGNKPGTFDSNVSSEPMNPISSRDVPMDIIRREGHKAVLQFAEAKRKFMKSIFNEILDGIKGKDFSLRLKAQKISLKDTNIICYSEVVDAIHNKCFNLGTHSHALEYLQYFVNACQYVHKDVVLESISKTCKHLRHAVHNIV